MVEEGRERKREIFPCFRRSTLSVCVCVRICVCIHPLIAGAQINVPLQCGIALFYKIMEFISQEIRQFPPTCQILTTCLQLLGQVSVKFNSGS